MRTYALPTVILPTVILPTVILPAVMLLAACSVSVGETATPGSGTGTSRSYAVAGFTGVALRGSDDVDVRVGTGFSVRAEGPARDLDRLRIVREGDTLRIGRVERSGFHWGGGQSVTVFVTMPRIVSAETAGSGDVKVDRVEGQRFTGRVAGSGGIDIAALSVREATLAIAGSGDIAAKGNVASLDAEVAGSGNVDASGLKVGDAHVRIMGSGNVDADVAGTAKVTVMGSGNADLGKAARCETTRMGSGEVRCGR